MHFPGFIAMFTLLLLPLWVKAESSDGDFPNFKVKGLVDLRYLHPDSRQSWLDQGLGKFRYGNDAGAQDLLRVNEAASVMQAKFDWDWSGNIALKYSDKQLNPVDLSEAFILYRPVSTTPWRFSGRLGAFIPPISMENHGLAWSSPYTLTSSAINSWVGEELKTIGGEGQLSYEFESGDRLGIFGSGFGNNDTAGTLLAWRGWSMHDYEATLNDRLPLPAHVGIDTTFTKQASKTQPFVEVDGRPGYYSGFSYERPEFIKFRAMYYDNRARPEIVKNGQYGWHTQFWSMGFKMDLPWKTTFIGQGMVGQTQMGAARFHRHAVDMRFWAHSLLLSKSWQQHRFSIRHDRFGSGENDYLPQDINQETGYAWTINYNYTWLEHHQVNLEVSDMHSNHKSRLRLGEPTLQEETLWQMSYRLFF